MHLWGRPFRYIRNEPLLTLSCLYESLLFVLYNTAQTNLFIYDLKNLAKIKPHKTWFIYHRLIFKAELYNYIGAWVQHHQCFTCKSMTYDLSVGLHKHPSANNLIAVIWNRGKEIEIIIFCLRKICLITESRNGKWKAV